MRKLKKVSVRDLQHNLAAYLDMASQSPIEVTKNGTPKAVILDLENFTYKKRSLKTKPKTKNILNSKFIGMHKERPDWKEKSNSEATEELRKKAWYGD